MDAGESAESIPLIREIGAEDREIPVTARRRISDPATEESETIVRGYRGLKSCITERLEITDPAIAKPSHGSNAAVNVIDITDPLTEAKRLG